ncbi:MAG TPA: hypothetical protein VNK41_01000 [Vicinamibacterales bacterium]|nr:hypothetical protein [Vicinamibacterales bacterium]
MTTIARPSLERRIFAALDASPPRVPVLLGGCGTGRTPLLLDLHRQIGNHRSQYVDLERSATTPERFHRALCLDSPFVAPDVSLAPGSPREAVDATLAFLTGARDPDGRAATFLLDEVLEFRTFESFPGLRHVMRDVLAALSRSGNRFVLTTRYTARALRWLRDAGPLVEVIQLPPLEVAEIRDAAAAGNWSVGDVDDIARIVHALTDGHPGHARALLTALAGSRRPDEADPVAALARLLEPGGALALRLSWSYELRLHRARGYGALKGILSILAEEEPLTLTVIAQRLQRTPGSTKDYLSWLEDVDLVRVTRKRYTFTDPLLRLWVRLHCRPSPPSDDDIVREVRQYALARIPAATGASEPAMAMATAHAAGDDERKTWGIIEID